MSFNNGYEKRKFDQLWEKEKNAMKEAGMVDETISKMYEFDKEFYNSRRRYEERWIEETTANWDGFMMEEDFDQNLNLLDQISDKKLFLALTKLKVNELELLMLYIANNMRVSDIAKYQGKSKGTISAKITRIINKIKYLQNNPNK